MAKFVMIGVLVCGLAITGGIAWLSLADLKPQQQPVHNVLPDSKFPR